ncbi:MAG: hypothetical protein U5S82_14580 [Gammaproteobacteria bacterium]|nr:hypothetical protein [Gammaproteobacteria bacterium]
MEDLAQLREALASDVDRPRVLFDDLRRGGPGPRRWPSAGGRVPLGGLGQTSTFKTVADVAASGVDFISVGGITKHIHAVDLSMRFV